MDNPSAHQMTYLKPLMESRPFLTRIPNQAILVTAAGSAESRIQATTNDDGSYAMIYITDNSQVAEVTVDMSALSGTHTVLWWFDPRTATNEGPQTLTNNGQQETFAVPTSSGPDWILVLDDQAAGYPPPGTD